MEKLRQQLQISFSTKVIFPVVITMVLLLALTVWTLNQRITGQFEKEAGRRLAMAEESVRKSQELHTKNLLLRYRNLPNEPRYKAALTSADAPTLKDWLDEVRKSELDVDVMLYTTIEKPDALASAKRDPLVSIAQFEASASNVIFQALRGEEKADAIRVGDRLFDVVSVPVFGVGDHLIGALTVGAEIGQVSAEELRDTTQCQIVLLANGHVIASTVRGPELRQQFADLFQQHRSSALPPGRRPIFQPPEEASSQIQKILLGDEHYFWTAGRFSSLSNDGKLGYLLLSSYEQPLRALQNTQQMLLLVSVIGIVLGSVVVWFLVRRITHPLRVLSDTAEAVGKGDFNRRVQVTSRDECGELASVFNQMTENLQRSREQLELTVETLKTTQAQLIQSEKLSGIGEFVAGVAHELNNPLTSVMGFSELLQDADTNPQHKRYLEMIHKSALRCQKIVQNLLSFARRHKPERKLSSINELVEGAIEILQYQMRTSNIEVSTSLDPNFPKALVDPHQVQQVFLNLLNNARQALEGSGAGVPPVRGAVASIPNKGSVHITTELREEKIFITFQDNGPGISEQNLAKIFDPFFTTKEVGKGTGLGLSLCFGIIKDHGGSISVRSKLGNGATFIIELPIAAQTDPRTASPATQTNQIPEPVGNQGNGKTVLVIDDEDAILHMVREILAAQGYEVDTVRDGETALQNLTHRRYDLALCDWKMPGLSGEQIYERIRASNPALSERMIFITGDVINDRTQKFLHERKKVCLSKPFSLSEFHAAVGKALQTS